MQAAADPAPQADETSSTDAVAKPVALVSPAPQGGQGAQRGYGFLNASAAPETAAQYSGDNVTSMFKMTSPVATQAAAAEQSQAGNGSGAQAAAAPAAAAQPTARRRPPPRIQFHFPIRSPR